MSAPNPDAPTQAQLNALRRLALASGTTFAWPATKWEASREITRLAAIGR